MYPKAKPIFLYVLAALPMTSSLLLTACESPQPTAGNPAETRVVPKFISSSVSDGEPLFLEASRTYSPSESATDGLVNLPVGLSFRIPHELPVVKGNAGNHSATLTVEARFNNGSARNRFICQYFGGSTETHPDDPLSQAQGKIYKLQGCSGPPAMRLSTGQMVAGEFVDGRVRLHVGSADSNHPQTLIRLRLRGQPGELAAPISAEESIRIRDAFSWGNTKALKELNAEGLPALYYGIVYLENLEQVQALDDLYMHHDSLPIFSEEREQWEGKTGVLLNEGDGHGVFKFVMFPGKLYNILRDAALTSEDDTVFRVLELRAIPTAAQGADGTISYAALQEAGFLYRGLESLDVADGVQSTSQPGLFSGLRKVVSAAATVVKAVVRTVVKAVAVVDRTLSGSVTMAVRIDLRNTDAHFGIGTPMQRAWGPNMGQQVNLPNVRVSVMQMGSKSVLPSLATGRTNDEGVVNIKVTKGKKVSSVCIDLDNKAAQLTTLLTETTYCSPGFDGALLKNDLTHNVTIADDRVHALAQASEGYAYLKGIMGYAPRKAKILVGGLANALGNVMEDSAIAPCLGISNLFYDSVIASFSSLALVKAGPVAAAAVTTAGTLYAVDIILPDGNGSNLRPRGVVSHEYGHFALCNLMRDEGIGAFSRAIKDVVVERLEFEKNKTISSGMTVNEAFADFFASQIAGGINYTHQWPNFSSVSSGSGSQWCLESSNDCLDHNFNGTALTSSERPEVVAIARLVSIFHDAVDGRTWARGSAPPSAPGNANVWTNGVPLSIKTENGFAVPGVAPSRDEVVSLTGNWLKQWPAHWFARGVGFEEKHVFGGLADVMTKQGYSWCEICPVFASHEPGVTGSLEQYRACARSPISDWMGAPPVSAEACCPAVTATSNIDKDATVFSRVDAAGSNFGQSARLQALTWSWNGDGRGTGTMRGFFDVNIGSLPADAEIMRATLHLSAAVTGDSAWPPGHTTANGASNAFIIRKVTSPWDESTITFNTQPTIDSTSMVNLPATTSSTQDYKIDITQLLQDKVKSPSNNHGFVLQLQQETPHSAVSFASSDHSNVGLRPYISFTYRRAQCQ